MAIQIIPEKLAGSGLSPSLPLFVYDDGTPPATIEIEAVIAAVDAAAGGIVPEDILGIVNDGNPGIQRLSHSSWNITINYREPNLRPLAPPTGTTVRPRFAAQAQRKEVRWRRNGRCSKILDSPRRSHGKVLSMLSPAASLACRRSLAR